MSTLNFEIIQNSNFESTVTAEIYGIEHIVFHHISRKQKFKYVRRLTQLSTQFTSTIASRFLQN